MEMFQKYSKFHAVSTRYKLDLYNSLPEGEYIWHAGTKPYTHLALEIKRLSPNKQFKITLKTVVLIWNFYLTD
jgi:hypothetical protein